ncbi:MAG TPA: hypothetical protein VHC22_16235 [Pirellulales bacterium]|nr:hypothetical protein [Pirellulales bacterium]
MEPADAEKLREAASRMARQLVQVVEPVLYGWEVAEAEGEFFEVVLAGLRELEGECKRGIG